MYRSSFRCVEQNLKWSVQSFLKTGMKPAGPHFLRTHTVSCSCTLRIRKMPRGSLISGEWVLHKTYILQKLIQRRKYAFVLFVFPTIVVFVTIIIRIFFFFTLSACGFSGLVTLSSLRAWRNSKLSFSAIGDRQGAAKGVLRSYVSFPATVFFFISYNYMSRSAVAMLKKWQTCEKCPTQGPCPPQVVPFLLFFFLLPMV